MINLIPIEEKKEIKKDFFYRFLVVALIMLTFWILIFLVSILPAYLISLEKKVSISKKLEIQKNEIMPEIDQKAQVALKELNTRLLLLEKSRKNNYIFSQKVINEIISKKVLGIKINKIYYENNSLGEKKISINGIAQNREQLLLFRQAFEDSDSFQNINLPISNFVKGKDIQFNLNLASK